MLLCAGAALTKEPNPGLSALNDRPCSKKRCGTQAPATHTQMRCTLRKPTTAARDPAGNVVPYHACGVHLLRHQACSVISSDNSNKQRRTAPDPAPSIPPRLTHICRTMCGSLAVRRHQQCTHASPQHSTRQLSTAQLCTNTWTQQHKTRHRREVMHGAWHVGEPTGWQTAADATTDTTEVAAAHAQLPINTPAHTVRPATAQHSPPARATQQHEVQLCVHASSAHTGTTCIP
jgi:hypothetical protein